MIFNISGGISNVAILVVPIGPHYYTVPYLQKKTFIYNRCCFDLNKKLIEIWMKVQHISADFHAMRYFAGKVEINGE